VFNIIKPCKSCKSYVLVPKDKLKLNLEELKIKLESLEFKTKAYTGTLLSTEKKCKINIYVSGKIVIVTRKEELVLKLEEELSNILYPYTKTNLERG